MKEKIRKLFSNVWTIPNVLTIIRMLLIPVFVVLFFHEQEIKWASLCVFCAASLTDMLDGYLARKLNQITIFEDPAMFGGIRCTDPAVLSPEEFTDE